MGLLNWIAKKRDASRLNEAIKVGDYEAATKIAATGHIDITVARETKQISEIAREIARGQASTFDTQLSNRIAAVMSIPSDHANQSGWKQLALRVGIRRLLAEGKVQEAIDVALQVGDPEIRSQALRCIALRVAPENAMDAVEMINHIGVQQYQQEEFRNLFLSVLIRREFDLGRRLASNLRSLSQGELSYRAVQFLRGDALRLFLGIPDELNWDNIVALVEQYHEHYLGARNAVLKLTSDPRVPLALCHCAGGRPEEAAKELNPSLFDVSNEVRWLRKNTFATFASAIAYAGDLPGAVQFLGLHTGAFSLLDAEVHLLLHCRFEPEATVVFASKLRDAYLFDQRLATGLAIRAIEMLTTGQSTCVQLIIDAVSNQNVRRIIIARLAESINAIVSA